MADRDDEQGKGGGGPERTAPPYEFSGGESSGDDDAPREGGQRREAPEYEFSGGESSGEQEKDKEDPTPETAATKTPDGTFKARHRSEREEAERERKAKAEEAEKRERRRKRLKKLGWALAPIALIALIVILVSNIDDEKTGGEQQGPPVGGTAIDKRFQGIEQDGLTLGNPKAPLTLVEFADLQCPFCKQSSDNVLPVLVDKYVRPGKLRIEFRNFAILGPDSEKAARALEAAAQQGRAWQFLDLWYLNQGEENTGYVTDEFIRKLARGARVPDAEAVVKRSNDKSTPDTLRAARTEANRFGVDGTPSFLLGKTGQTPTILQIQDPSDPNLFTQAIDRQLGGPQE